VAKKRLKRHFAARTIQGGSMARKKFALAAACGRAEQEVDEVVTMLTRFG
jgi:hypothetical protein